MRRLKLFFGIVFPGRTLITAREDGGVPARSAS